MKLIVSSLNHGQLIHNEIELPKGFLDISLEMDSGPIFQIVTDDMEDSIFVSEKTFRHLAIEPKSANHFKVKGI
jgi:hypothetical protein